MISIIKYRVQRTLWNVEFVLKVGKDWLTLSHVSRTRLFSVTTAAMRARKSVEFSRRKSLRRENAVCVGSRENNFASLLRRGSSGLSCQVVSLSLPAYNICTRVAYVLAREKFDCTKRTIRGQCTWRPANATSPTNLAIVRELPLVRLYIRFLGVWALLPEESRSWNFIVTGGEERKRGERRGMGEFAEQAIYSNRWFIRAFERPTTVELFRSLTLSSLPWYPPSSARSFEGPIVPF